ncbi:hypothetical protein MFRU_005g00160 [Monilinia fructicola]|nr:hypothetical protein MFRU_005g00160 [Monilinia fructicola]
MSPKRYREFKGYGPQPSNPSSVNSPWPKLINLDMVWLINNGWPSFEDFMAAHNCQMSDREQFLSAITIIQHLRWTRTKLPHITKAHVNARFGLRYDYESGLYVPILPQMQRNRNTSGPSISVQDRKGKSTIRIASEYDNPELYDRSIESSSNVQPSHNKGKSRQEISEEDDTVKPLSIFKTWRGKSATCVSEEEKKDYFEPLPNTKIWKGKSVSRLSEEVEEDYFEPMPSTKAWKGKSVRWKSEGDEIIGPISNTKQTPPVKQWTRTWSNEIDELRKSCEATSSSYTENEGENLEDGGVSIDDMLQSLDLECISSGEDESLGLGVSLGDSSPDTFPSSSSEPMTSTESLENSSEKK